MNKTYTKKAMSQRTGTVSLSSPRGVIYDRNMLRLTDCENTTLEGNTYPSVQGTRNILNHVIGYVSPDGGGCGIEWAFDYILSGSTGQRASYIKDINNNMISDGYSMEVTHPRDGVCLTVDLHIQKIAEDAMDAFKINGGVVVADCKSGEILAMASRPNFDPTCVYKYLEGRDGELLNKTVCEYNPGSVFKIVVLTAYLENNYNDEMLFECRGSTVIDGREYVCHKRDGHGVQTLEQAFANSCNCAFYTIGDIVGAEEIYKYASSLGIGCEVLGINGFYEAKGGVPARVKTKGELANISIGQGSVMTTPLQIADILCTICSGGVKKQLTLVKGIVDEKGNCNVLDTAVQGRVMSKTTARRLGDMLNNAVSHGTGKGAKPRCCSAGGKTGSAETGWKKDGAFMQQGWFAGYFPAENPKYVCVVMAENGISGSASACPVFKKISEEIYLSRF